MSRLIGEPLPRVDAPLKVTGRATYAAEHRLPDLAHAVIISAAVGKGRILEIDSRRALGEPGVLAVISHLNTARLPYRPHKGWIDPTVGERLHVLQDDFVRHWGQPVAVVVAETLEQAEHASHLVGIRYEAEAPSFTVPDGESIEPQGGYPANYSRGDADQALATAEHRVDCTYLIPRENHNPIEPHATIAQWDGQRLTVWDKTQFPTNVAEELAAVFGLERANVHLICPFVGGAFGTSLRTWPHTTLAALAARHVGRPVKLVLTRKQMYFGTGYRPETWQRVRLGAHSTGELTALKHEGIAETSRYEHYIEGLLNAPRFMYSCPHVTTSYRLVPQDVHTPTYMRAPGAASGMFALECAMDELAHELRIDPVELRLRNEPKIDESRNVPFSSRSLVQCLRTGAERIRWHRRRAEPGALREGHWLVGLGVASATYHTLRNTASARVRLRPDGTAVIETAAADMGPGTYTSLTQIACDELGLPPEKVQVVIGDSNLPRVPPHGGSQTLSSVGSAVLAACLAARSARQERAHSGAIAGSEIVATETSQPGDATKRYSMHAFGAVFAEVMVDVDLGIVRLAHMVGVYAAGRIVNPRLAHSQAIGGMVGGVGMALLEETHIDRRDGRITNANLAEYLVPTNADIPVFDAVFLDEHDPHVNPLGVKGIGELSYVGVAAAIANAVFNATGKRIRDLPITLEKLL
ncbi:MAG: xanthine dehydrogenase family protein molybdopterin-binding subunit [Steroidobacteraceae bacterium]|nr:xanthine dehydrogenase family protein molybdopterin-binding subunit [Steroidobacteraceae bacterium]